MIRTLIVEDDFRVARIHAGFTEQVVGFEVIGQAHTAEAARQAITTARPDFLLLDLYLPDANGLDVLRHSRTVADPPDTIVLTAAADMASVREAMQCGALHYLIKPFSAAALQARLRGYAELHARRSVARQVDQRDVDGLYALLRRGGDPTVELPKGRSAATAAVVHAALRDADTPLSSSEVAERAGISRATAQRYLSALTDAGVLKMALRYGSSGRPEHEYALPDQPA